MITLVIYKNKDSEKPLVVYSGNIAFKFTDGSIYVFGASDIHNYDVYRCAKCFSPRENAWNAYMEY